MAKPLPLIDPELLGDVNVEATVQHIEHVTRVDRSVLREGFHTIGDEVKNGAIKLFELAAEEDEDKGLFAAIFGGVK